MKLDMSFFIFLSGLTNFFIWLVVAGFSINKLRIPIYHPFFIYLIYHFIGYILRPMYIYINSGSFLWDRIGLYPDGIDIIVLTAVCNIALISVFIGFLVGAGDKIKVLNKPEPFHIVIGKPLTFYLILILLVAMGLYANYISIAGAGLDTVLAYQTEVDSSGGGRLVGTSGYVTALAEFLPPICIMLFMIPKIRKIAYILVASYILMRFFAGAQRLSFVIVVAGILFYFLINKKRRYPTLPIIISIVLFAFVFDIIGSDRYAMRKLISGETNIQKILTEHDQSRGNNGLTSDVVEYDVAAVTLSVINNNSAYSYGTQYLRILIWPIPRQIWEDKPVFTSIVNLNDYGDFRYLTTGVYADSFMAFSYISLTFLMFLLGYFFSKMYKVLISSTSVIYILFYWVVLIFTKTILRDGGVTFIYFWFFSMVPIFILSKFGKLRIVR